MTKNITVTDENENIIGSTYPKRALGLVKKGRARWINADTICLCAQNMEEKTMTNNFYEIFDNQITKMQEQLKDIDFETSMPLRMQILKTMETFRAQEQGTKILDMIQDQLNFLKEDFAKTADIDFANHATGGIAFKAREVTKQRMLSLMEKLINATMMQENPNGDFQNKSVADEFCCKIPTGNSNNNESLAMESSDKLNE